MFSGASFDSAPAADIVRLLDLGWSLERPAAPSSKARVPTSKHAAQAVPHGLGHTMSASLTGAWCHLTSSWRHKPSSKAPAPLAYQPADCSRAAGSWSAGPQPPRVAAGAAFKGQPAAAVKSGHVPASGLSDHTHSSGSNASSDLGDPLAYPGRGCCTPLMATPSPGDDSRFLSSAAALANHHHLDLWGAGSPRAFFGHLGGGHGGAASCLTACGAAGHSQVGAIASSLLPKHVAAAGGGPSIGGGGGWASFSAAGPAAAAGRGLSTTSVGSSGTLSDSPAGTRGAPGRLSLSLAAAKSNPIAAAAISAAAVAAVPAVRRAIGAPAAGACSGRSSFAAAPAATHVEPLAVASSCSASTVRGSGGSGPAHVNVRLPPASVGHYANSFLEDARPASAAAAASRAATAAAALAAKAAVVRAEAPRSTEPRGVGVSAAALEQHTSVAAAAALAIVAAPCATAAAPKTAGRSASPPPPAAAGGDSLIERVAWRYRFSRRWRTAYVVSVSGAADALATAAVAGGAVRGTAQRGGLPAKRGGQGRDSATPPGAVAVCPAAAGGGDSLEHAFLMSTSTPPPAVLLDASARDSSNALDYVAGRRRKVVQPADSDDGCGGSLTSAPGMGGSDAGGGATGAGAASGGERQWIGQVLPRTVVDTEGRFSFILVRLVDELAGRSRLLVRGRRRLGPCELLEDLRCEMAWTARKHRLPVAAQATVLAAGTLEFGDGCTLAIHLPASRQPAPSDSGGAASMTGRPSMSGADSCPARAASPACSSAGGGADAALVGLDLPSATAQLLCDDLPWQYRIIWVETPAVHAPAVNALPSSAALDWRDGSGADDGGGSDSIGGGASWAGSSVPAWGEGGAAAAGGGRGAGGCSIRYFNSAIAQGAAGEAKARLAGEGGAPAEQAGAVAGV